MFFRVCSAQEVYVIVEALLINFSYEDVQMKRFSIFSFALI